MLPELTTLREVQMLDLRLSGCDRELGRVPGAIAAIDRKIETAKAALRAVEAELRQAAADRRHAETELEEAEANVEKTGDQLLSARTNDEYRGLQQQIENTKKRIGTIEDRILALMEQTDTLEAKQIENRRAFNAEETVLESEKQDIRVREREQREQRDELRGKRTEVFARLPDEVAARYERIRGARHGVAVAPVREDRCSACNVRLRPQLVEEVHAGQSVLACESCARLLVFGSAPAETS